MIVRGVTAAAVRPSVATGVRLIVLREAPVLAYPAVQVARRLSVVNFPVNVLLIPAKVRVNIVVARAAMVPVAANAVAVLAVAASP